jgi:hypothetical protein
MMKFVGYLVGSLGEVFGWLFSVSCWRGGVTVLESIVRPSGTHRHKEERTELPLADREQPATG